MTTCPVCRGTTFTLAIPAARLQAECGLRETFVQQRLARPASDEELKDLTDFFHNEAADLLECAACHLLVRHQYEPPPAQEYAEDEYDPSLMERLYPRYLEAFRKKENPYRALLSQNARVLEVGSHYGAFLQTAAEWGWQAEGVDVGKDTSRFAQSKGFRVHTTTLEQCPFVNATFDGIFIWNCFEQIEDPHPTLQACQRLLRPGGLLVVRTPNALFYLLCQTLLKDQSLTESAQAFLLDALGYNNLLGFPYLYGHRRSTLGQLIEPHGFRFGNILNSELIVFPLPQNPAWVEREEQIINTETRLLANSVLLETNGTATGPWIELWFHSQHP